MNSLGASVTVVVVARDRYSTLERSVEMLFDSLPSDVRILVVAGGASGKIRRRLEKLHSLQVEVVGSKHHLVPNEARNLGLSLVSTPYVVFFDNDSIPHPGWLPPLLETMERFEPMAVMPLILERTGPTGPTSIHVSGGECRIVETVNGRTFVDEHRHIKAPIQEAETLAVEKIHLLEFHCVLFERKKLQSIGAFDESIESQGEHLDLALRIAEAGGEMFLDPRSRVTVEFPTSLRAGDFSFYLGRWSSTFNRRSYTRFVEKWSLDDSSAGSATWSFADRARFHPWIAAGKVIQRLTRRWTPEGIARQIDLRVGRHVAEMLLRVSPRWAHWRTRARTTAVASKPKQRRVRYPRGGG